MNAFVHATIGLISILLVAGIGYSLKKIINIGKLRRYLRNIYSDDDAARTETALIYGTSFILLVVFVFVVIPLIIDK